MKEEFQCKKFLLHHEDVERFYKPLFKFVDVFIHAGIRFIFAAYLITFMLISIVWDHNSPRWLVFATSWNYILVTIYFIYAFGVSFVTAFMNINKTNKVDTDASSHAVLPWWLKVLWVFYNIAMTLCFTVVVLYWALLHDYDKPLNNGLDSYLTIDRHGVNLILLLIDFMIHKIPFQFFHFTFPFIVAATYAIFNVSYWAATDELIYTIFDWSGNPTKASLLMVGLIVFVVIAQFLLYWIHRVKDCCYPKKEPANYHANDIV